MRSHFYIFIFFISTFFLPFKLYAVTWTGAGGNTLWTNAGNWDGAVPNSVGATATFTVGVNTSVSINAAIQLGILQNNLQGGLVLLNSAGGSLTINNKMELAYPNGSYEAFINNLAYDELIFASGASIDMSAPARADSYFENGNFSGTNVSVIGPGNITNGLGAAVTTLTLSSSVVVQDTSPTNLSRTTNLVLGTGCSLTISNVAGNISTNISGAGTVSFAAAANTVTLSGTNTYSGATTIGAGRTISGSTSSISSSSNIANSGTLVFSQSSSGTYASAISGSGAVTKSGSGTVTFSGTNTYTGATNITAGTLSVTGTLHQDSDITISSGATLTGSGNVGSVDNTNGGTVQAGLTSADTLAITGTYDQNSAATMKSFISPSSASKLTVSGVATLAGTLSLEVGSGVYPDGTSFTVLTAGTIAEDENGLGAGFDNLVESHSGVWSMSQSGNSIIVTVTGGAIVVTPVNLSGLSGNSSIVGNYMFLDPNFVTSNSDLQIVADVMTALPALEFENSLIAVSPLTAAAVPFSAFQNDLQMAVVLDRQFHKKKNAIAKKNSDPEERLCSAYPKTGLFIEPIGVFYRQQRVGGPLTNQGQIPFQSYTYGAGIGWDQVLDDQFILEGGVGYTHSNLNWKDDFGNAWWSTLYLAPFFGWFNEKAFANFMIMAGFNFHKTERRILFPNLERVAKSRYESYDLLLRANGGYRLYMGESFWFQPEGTLNYLTIFTSGYTEKDAGSISLQVKRNTNYILQPSLRGKLIKQFTTKKMCYAPNIYLGWLANLVLQDQTLSARFVNAPNQVFFNIQGYRKNTYQMIVGAEYYMQRKDKFILTSNFEADLLSHMQIFTATVKFEWLF